MLAPVTESSQDHPQEVARIHRTYRLVTKSLRNVLHKDMGNNPHWLQWFSQEKIKMKTDINNIISMSLKSQCLLPGLSYFRYNKCACWCSKIFLSQQCANGIPKYQIKRSTHLAFTSSSMSNPSNAHCSQMSPVHFYDVVKKPHPCLSKIA